jgi:hypothetical protein
MAFPGTTGQFVTAAEWNTILQSIGLNGVTVPGWVDAQSAWAYVSANSFKVVGADVTKRYPVGTKLSCTDAAASKYFYVLSSSYAASDTTVTITAGSDYTLSGGAITNPRYSYASNAQGFPGYFLHTPACTGWSATPTTTGTWLSINGRIALYNFYVDGTSTTTAASLVMPVTPLSQAYGPLERVYNNGILSTDPTHYAYAAGASATLTFYRTGSAAGWTNANEKLVAGQILFPI